VFIGGSPLVPVDQLEVDILERMPRLTDRRTRAASPDNERASAGWRGHVGIRTAMM
jgi:hypothetical protein